MMAPGQRSFIAFKHRIPRSLLIRKSHEHHKHRIKLAGSLRHGSLRFHALNGGTVANHFSLLKHTIKENGIDEDDWFNLDEVGISLERDFVNGMQQSPFLTCRGPSATPDERMMNSTLEHHVTIMSIIFASGEYGTTLVVFKRENIALRSCSQRRTKYMENTEKFLPRRTVVLHRYERSSVDDANFFD